MYVYTYCVCVCVACVCTFTNILFPQGHLYELPLCCIHQLCQLNIYTLYCDYVLCECLEIKYLFRSVFGFIAHSNKRRYAPRILHLICITCSLFLNEGTEQNVYWQRVYNTVSTISVISRGMLNVAFTQIEYYTTNPKSTVAASRIVHMFICPFKMSSS